MTKAINFRKIPVEYEIGSPKEIDVRRTIGNEINKNTADIGLADIARKIYYSEEEIEVPEEFIMPIINIIRGSEIILAACKIAVINLLSGTEGNLNNSLKNKTK